MLFRNITDHVSRTVSNYCRRIDVDNNATKTYNNLETEVEHDYTQSVGNTSQRTYKANDIKTVDKEEVHTIKGNKTQTIEKDFTTIVGGDKNTYVEQDMVDEIKNILHTYIEGDVTDRYLENFFIQVGREMGVDISGSLHIDTSSVKYESQTLTEIEATECITLQCGAHALVIDPTGIYFKTDNYTENSGESGVVADAVAKIKIAMKYNAKAFDFSV